MYVLVTSLLFSLLTVEVQGAASSQPQTPRGKSTRSRLPSLTQTPENPFFLFSDEHDIIESLVNIFKDKKNARIYVNSFFFTDYALAHALAKLCTDPVNDVSVFALVDSISTGHGKIALRILADAGADVRVYHGTEQNHNKYVIWSYVDSDGVEKYGLYSGSANLTNLARYNIEQGIITRIPKAIFDDYRRDFSTLYRPSCRFVSETAPATVRAYDPIYSTPTSSSTRTTHSSFETPTAVPPATATMTTLFTSEDGDKSPSSVIDRVKKTLPGGEIYISAYTYDWPLLTNKLCKACRRGVTVSIVVDPNALIQKRFADAPQFKLYSKEQLDKLAHAGATIMVYRNEGLKSHHQKIIALKDNNRTIIGQGSANFTASSKHDKNTWNWISHHQGMFNIIKRRHKNASQSSAYIPYALFCAEHEEKSRIAAYPPTSMPTGSSSRMIRPTQSSFFDSDHPLADDLWRPY